jgi:hypothetical protein
VTRDGSFGCPALVQSLVTAEMAKTASERVLELPLIKTQRSPRCQNSPVLA